MIGATGTPQTGTYAVYLRYFEHPLLYFGVFFMPL